MISRRLFFGASSLLGFGDGFGVGVYDAVEDAIHVWASRQDDALFVGGTYQERWIVDDVVFYGGYVWCSVRGHGIFRTPMRARDADQGTALYDISASGGAIGPFNGGWYTSSDFDAGTPGLQKLWRSVTVHADLPDDNCSIHVEVSTDGGRTYASAGSVTKTSPTQTRYATELMLEGSTAGTTLRSSRLKYRLTLRSTNGALTPELLSVSVAYLPIPDPGWQWEMVLVCNRQQILLDKTKDDAVDVEAKVQALDTAFRTQTPLPFTDIDGVEWASSGASGVLIKDIVHEVNFVGPSDDGMIERELRVTLLEVVEQYEA